MEPLSLSIGTRQDASLLSRRGVFMELISTLHTPFSPIGLLFRRGSYPTYHLNNRPTYSLRSLNSAIHQIWGWLVYYYTLSSYNSCTCRHLSSCIHESFYRSRDKHALTNFHSYAEQTKSNKIGLNYSTAIICCLFDGRQSTK